jgi:hypothetical protein
MGDSQWITFSTTPPSSQDEFDQLVAALGNANIPTDIEENQARQCANDVAFWLRVRLNDLPLARSVAQKIL